MATKSGKVVTYYEECLLIELLDPSITWFGEVKYILNTHFIINYIYRLALEQWPSNLARW